MLKICVAGKNACSIKIVSFLEKKISKKNILILPNKGDKGINEWQPSLKNYAKKKKLKIVKEKDLYKIKNLIFISIEYEEILDVRRFSSKELFNIHFSLLPKYRGCHTNYLQIKNGEKYSGVTIHKIDSGIDTGNIIDQIKYKVNVNIDALKNYNKLMHFSVLIFVKNFKKIILNKYTQKKQNNKNSSYFSRKYVNYNKEKFIAKRENTLKFHNRIRALIFPPFQLPIYKGKKIEKTIFKKRKVYLKFAKY